MPLTVDHCERLTTIIALYKQVWASYGTGSPTQFVSNTRLGSIPGLRIFIIFNECKFLWLKIGFTPDDWLRTTVRLPLDRAAPISYAWKCSLFVGKLLRLVSKLPPPPHLRDCPRKCVEVYFQFHSSRVPDHIGVIFHHFYRLIQSVFGIFD